MDVQVDGRAIKLSNVDKILYPATGFTKGQVIGVLTPGGPAGCDREYAQADAGQARAGRLESERRAQVDGLRVLAPRQGTAKRLDAGELGRALKQRRPSLLSFGPEAVLKRVEQHGDLFSPAVTMKQKLPGLESLLRIGSRYDLAPSTK